MKKVLVLDTSILCVWLHIPKMDNCGPEDDKWDYNRVDKKISDEIHGGTLLVLPMATIIETGNHITQSGGDRYSLVNRFADLVICALDGHSPWAAFTSQNSIWSSEGLRQLIERWRKDAIVGLSMGDVSILDVAEYYAQAGNNVEILTGDQGLKSYEPVNAPIVPRRRH